MGNREVEDGETAYCEILLKTGCFAVIVKEKSLGTVKGIHYAWDWTK